MPRKYTDLNGGEIVQAKVVKIADQILLGVLGAMQGEMQLKQCFSQFLLKLCGIIGFCFYGVYIYVCG